MVLTIDRKTCSISWDPIAEVLETNNKFPTLVILDACHAGTALMSFKRAEKSSNKSCFSTHIDLLAATSHHCTTPDGGKFTFTKNISNAMSLLLNDGKAVSVKAMFRSVRETAIKSGHGCPSGQHVVGRSASADACVVPALAVALDHLPCA